MIVELVVVHAFSFRSASYLEIHMIVISALELISTQRPRQTTKMDHSTRIVNANQSEAPDL